MHVAQQVIEEMKSDNKMEPSICLKENSSCVASDSEMPYGNRDKFCKTYYSGP